MIVLYLILLAVIQAVTEFLPVSSLGHLGVMEHFLGMEQDAGLLIESMLHLGTAAAIIFLYRNELKRLLLESLSSAATVSARKTLPFWAASPVFTDCR